MGVFSLEKLFGMTIRESATDGSDFTNPDADYRRLFLGEDGQLHVKDSAGSVTDIGGGAGGIATDSLWDAAGDLAVGSGANTAAKLTKGSDGTVLTISPSTHVPVWAAPAGGALASDTNTVATNQSTTNTGFVDLATTGPAVTITVNTKVLVIVSAEIIPASATGQYGAMGFAASGGNTVAAARTKALIMSSGTDFSNTTIGGMSRSIMLTGLTPGSTTFTAKYSSLVGGTVNFQNRDITVICLD